MLRRMLTSFADGNNRKFFTHLQVISIHISKKNVILSTSALEDTVFDAITAKFLLFYMIRKKFEEILKFLRCR